MSILVFGLCVWMFVHFLPSLAPALRQQLIQGIGENAYKGVFALLIIFSVVCMALGWRSMPTPLEQVYIPAPELRHLAMFLMLIAFILFGSAKAPVRIKRYIRHPQLTSILIWASAHLLANGELRSVILFAGMALWALLEMIFINRREGAWIKPEVGEWSREVKVLLISVIIMMLAMYFHPWFSGVALF